MEKKLLKLLPPYSPDELKADANEFLDSVKKDNYETVIVFGYKNGGVQIRMNRMKSRLELMGALEAAKAEIWKDE